MNLISLLIAPAVVLYATGSSANTGLRVTIAVVAALVVAVAVTISKRKPIATGADLSTDSKATTSSRPKANVKR